MAKLRLGLVDVLESRPLVWSFLKGHHSDLFDTSSHRPARVAELLRQGELDVGLIPSIELPRLEGVKILPDLCISSRGSASRVLLQLRGSSANVGTVAVGRGTRSAVALMRIVLREEHDVAPEVILEHDSSGPLAAECDARLVAGDAALLPGGEDLESLDLGAGWERVSGRPYVAALWAVRDGVDLPQLSFYFKSGLRYGLASLDHLLREAAAETGLDPQLVRRFLERDLYYVLGSEQLEGLEDLWRRAEEPGLDLSRGAVRFWTE